MVCFVVYRQLPNTITKVCSISYQMYSKMRTKQSAKKSTGAPAPRKAFSGPTGATSLECSPTQHTHKKQKKSDTSPYSIHHNCCACCRETFAEEITECSAAGAPCSAWLCLQCMRKNRLSSFICDAHGGEVCFLFSDT
jgi:hypothetical protein